MGYGLEKKLKEDAKQPFKICYKCYQDLEEGKIGEVPDCCNDCELFYKFVKLKDVEKELGVVAQKIQEQARKGNDIEDHVRSARNAYRRKDLPFETYNKIRDEKFVPLDSVLGLIVDSGTLETLKIMKDKKLMKLLRESRKKGSTSSPYKPLVEGEK